MGPSTTNFHDYNVIYMFQILDEHEDGEQEKDGFGRRTQNHLFPAQIKRLHVIRQKWTAGLKTWHGREIDAEVLLRLVLDESRLQYMKGF